MNKERRDGTIRRFIVAGLAAGFISGGSPLAADLEAGPDLANGEAHYNVTCVACHGENGKGAIPGVPDFTNAKGPLSKDDETLMREMHDGLQSPGSPIGMPPMGGMEEMTTEDLADVLAYIRTAFETK